MSLWRVVVTIERAALIAFVVGFADQAAAQQSGAVRLVMVTETSVRPDRREEMYEFRVATTQNHVRASRPYPYTVATEDRGTLVFITRDFTELGDWERWADANDATALPAPPTGPRTDSYSQLAWFMQERPEWSYAPASPRVRREEAGFIHWDIYYGRQAMTRWGIPQADAAGLGYLPNPQHFQQLIELHRSRLPAEGFAVYTTYATGHPRHGAALIIETWAESEQDYYSRLVANQMALGREGHQLLVGLLGNSSGSEDYDLEVLPELSYRGR